MTRSRRVAITPADLNEAGYIVGSVRNKNGTSRPAFWTPGGTLLLLGSVRGEGGATGISDGAVGLVIGGQVVTGRSVTD